MRIRSWVVAVGTAAAVGAGALGATAMASSTPSTTTTSTSTTTNPVSAFITDLAGHLGIPVTTLESAIQQTATDQVQQAEQNGLLTAAQAQKIDQRIQSGNFAALLPPMRGPGKGPREMGVRFGSLKAATQYLGLTAAQVRSDLQSGKSLDDIANGITGKSASGLQAAIVAAVQAQLQSAVTAGRITATQEQNILNRLQSTLPKLLSATHPFAAMRRDGHGRWMRGAWMHRGHGASTNAAPMTPPASSSTTSSTTSSSSSAGPA